MVEAFLIGQPQGLELVEPEHHHVQPPRRPPEGTKTRTAEAASNTPGNRWTSHDASEHMLETTPRQAPQPSACRFPIEAARSGTHPCRAEAYTGRMKRIDWPDVHDVTALPENHRRAIAAALGTLRENLEHLERRRELTLPGELVARLTELEGALRGAPPRRHPLSVLAALRGQVDEIEASRLAAYGPLSSSQRATIDRLAGALRDQLDRVHAETSPSERVPLTLRAIGVVRSPFEDQPGTPIQPRYADGIEGTIEIFPEYRNAMADLDGFERIWVLSHLNRGRPWRSKVVPYRDTTQRGLFSTRAPSRPNPIGLSCLRLLAVRHQEGILTVADLDLLDRTPVLDIKPYSPRFDAYPQARAGWLDRTDRARETADERFGEPEYPPTE